MREAILFFTLFVPFVSAYLLFLMWLYRNPLRIMRGFVAFHRKGPLGERWIFDFARRIAEPTTNGTVRAVWSTFTLGPALLFGVRLSLRDQVAAMDYILTHPKEPPDPTNEPGHQAWRKYQTVIRRMCLFGILGAAGILLTVPIGALVRLAR